MSLLGDDSVLFGFESGFESGAWLARIRAAESGEARGSLGPYQLLEEAGRGGQGVVYRARQPGTGRVIAVKRLLAGAFAPPAALRRFEREVEATTTLDHPGIVTVYGLDVVDGVPLLAMEWIEGRPVTRWAEGRARAEILRCFLELCDALQHAHQRGVLHRDLKPSNVVVDGSDRPRVLDFGLAKLAGDQSSSISATGGFLGTPAYAAPEQWRGEEVDARADVYALGAILFELLTGRRVIEGDGLDALARAARPLEPPRPSSYAPSVPRELDAIVRQALRDERAERYQSVDALSADIRRFQSGKAVLAHPPSAWYLLRKLVARNRTVAAMAAMIFVALIVAALAYAVVSTRHADRLGEERDRALQAGVAERAARVEAETEKERAKDEKRLAEAARAEADRERARAEEELRNTESVLEFFAEDMVRLADPIQFGSTPTLVELFRAAVPKIPERFGASRAVEARVHMMLGSALRDLGSYEEAESELRASLATDPSQDDNKTGQYELALGYTLFLAGEYASAEEVLRRSIQHLEAAAALNRPSLFNALDTLAGVLMMSSRFEEAIAVEERAIELAHAPSERLFARANLAALFLEMGRSQEARIEYTQVMSEMIATGGERTLSFANLLVNLAVLDQDTGDPDSAEERLRRSLEITLEIFGEEHPNSALTMGRLASNLADYGNPEEGEELARQALGVLEGTADSGNPMSIVRRALGVALFKQGDLAEAEIHLAEAVRLGLAMGDEYNWRKTVADLNDVLIAAGKLEEADRRLQELETQTDVGLRSWALRNRAAVCILRKDVDGAYRFLDAAVAMLQDRPEQRPALVVTLQDYARMLRKTGDRAGAEALELEAAELAK